MATQFATEQGHWYALDGTPQYTIIGKNGKERNTTLRDAREHNLAPSVTTVIRCAAAPQLERWKRDQVLMAALTLPRIDGELETDWLARVEHDWQEQGRQAANRGTAIHGAIEKHFRGEQPDEDLWPFVVAARDEIWKHCDGDGTDWRPERSFAHHAGYGGKCDLHSDAWVIDVKTKDGDPPRGLYDEHIMQLAAYRRGLDVMAARCGILYVGREEPSAALVEASQDDLRRGLEMFDGLLAYWQAKTGYRPEPLS
jgi:hypothetical protein